MNDKQVDLEKALEIPDFQVDHMDEQITFSFWESMVKMVTQPSRAFIALRDHPRILYPMLMFVLISAISTFLTWGLMKDAMLQGMQSQMQAQGQVGEIPEFTMRIIMGGIVFGVIAGIPLAIAFKGMLVHVFMMVFGGEGSMKQSIAIVANAYLVIMIEHFIRTPLALLSRNVSISFSPAVFLQEAGPLNPWYGVLANFDVFIIWYLILSVIGVSIIHRVPKWKAAVAVFVPYLIIVGFGVFGVVMQSLIN